MSTDDKKNIVIIGGGIIGCTSAYYLTRHPSYDSTKHNIIVLEANKIASGASGKAGGLLALWAYPSSLVPLSYRLHKELAAEHSGEERWGYRAVHCGQVDCVGRDLSKESAKNSKAGENNTTNTDTISLQKRSKAAPNELHAAGVPPDLDWISPSTLVSYEKMGDPSTTAQVHPYHFTTSLAALAAEKGAHFKEHSPVTTISYNPTNTRIQSITYTTPSSSTPQTLPATHIILAAGPWTPTLFPPAPITAVRAHSLTITPTRPVSAYALFTEIHQPKSSQTTTSPEIYPRPTNEVYACGAGDTRVPLPPSTADVSIDGAACDEIFDAVASISDELRDGTVTARQACYLPGVEGSSAPLVGWTGVEGLVMAAGHTCWGIQNAPATGKVVSEFVFEGEGRSAKVGGLDPRKFLR